jgi:hypothetical protein
LDAQAWNAQTIPAYHENQFGATLGFPIWRNRFFYFGDAEANRITFGQTVTATVPTPLMRQGNFTELLNTNLTGSAQPVQLYQPNSGGTAPLSCNGVNNTFCSSQIDPVAKTLLNLFPAPNANGGDTYNNVVLNVNDVNNTWQWDQRLDWNISAKDQTYARYSYLLDRTNGHLLLAKPFVKVTWASGIGSDARPQQLAEDRVVCPGVASNWNAAAFSPLTRLYYVMATEECDATLLVAKGKHLGEEAPTKYLEALDIHNGKIVWKIHQIGPADGKRDAGTLATSGGLLFYGDPTGDIVAAAARTGKTLWHFPTNGENKASPMTYTVNNQQFVALAVGPNILAFSLP